MVEKIISFGAGVNSTAMVLLLYEQGKRFPIIFADTGCEWPETYEFLALFNDYLLKTWGTQVCRVQSERGNMYQWYWERRQIPFIKARVCTGMWKLEPIAKAFPGVKVHLVGISIDEVHRVRPRGRYAQLEYPLVEIGMTRQDCKAVIKRHGLPVPIRSGCFICPFQSLRDFTKLAELHPDLFNKVVALEERSGRWLKYEKPLRKLVNTQQLSLQMEVN